MKTSDTSVDMVEEIGAKPIGWLAVTRAPWFEWLRRELAPAPGRREMAVRLVVGVVLGTIISMSLQVAECAVIERDARFPSIARRHNGSGSLYGDVAVADLCHRSAWLCDRLCNGGSAKLRGRRANP